MILSDEQKRIVRLSAGKHLVLSPPGTGKTELLALRVENALNKGVPSEKMVCLTFTNRAYREMKVRIEKKYPENDVFVGNIHRFCAQWLIKNKIISSFVSLMDEDDSNQLLGEAKKLTHYPGETRNEILIRLSTFLVQKELGFRKEILLPPPENEILSPVQDKEVCKKYQELKCQNTLLDYDDLLTNTIFALYKNPSVSPKYSWVQADEAQDLNPLQWEIVNLISAEDAHQVLFGDYDQAIFSFMGSKIERLVEMEKKYELHMLRKNYRSPSYLLDVFSKYAMQNFPHSRYAKTTSDRTSPPDGDSLLLAEINGSEEDEAEYIVRCLLSGLLKKSSGQTAILVRYNATAETFSRLLDEGSMNHFKISGFDLFHRKTIKDMLAFLFCLSDPTDRTSWFRLFHLFGGCSTLQEAREFVTMLFLEGVFPTDVLAGEIGKPMIEFADIYRRGRFVVFDTETTGLDVNVDDIIQIAAIEILDGKIGRDFEVYLKTEKSLEKTEKIHNISTALLEKCGVEPKKALSLFVEFTGNDPLVAHNISFDREILFANMTRYGLPEFPRRKYFDTCDLIRRLYPKRVSYKLSDLLEDFSVSGKNTHNALEDVRATVNLIKFFIPQIEKKGAFQFARFTEDPGLRKFRKNFAAFWALCMQNLDTPVSLAKFARAFLSFAEETVNYKIDDKEEAEISKLLNYMEARCGTEPLKKLLKKRVSDYRYFKEADLVLEDERIVVSTVHKAKGLQFENVIIPGCVQDVYPHWNSKKEEQRNEDARLLYVAMSRAMSRLVLTTHSIFKSKNGYKFTRQRSPFLECITQNFLKKRV